MIHLWAVYSAFTNIKIINQVKFHTLDPSRFCRGQRMKKMFAFGPIARNVPTGPCRCLNSVSQSRRWGKKKSPQCWKNEDNVSGEEGGGMSKGCIYCVQCVCCRVGDTAAWHQAVEMRCHTWSTSPPQPHQHSALSSALMCACTCVCMCTRAPLSACYMLRKHIFIEIHNF